MSWFGQKLAQALNAKKVAKDVRIRSRFRTVRGFMMTAGATVAAGLAAATGALIHDPHVGFVLAGALMPVGTFGGAIVAYKAQTTQALRLAASQEPINKLALIEEAYYQELDEIDSSGMSEANKAKYREQAFLRNRNRKDAFNQEIFDLPPDRPSGQLRLVAPADKTDEGDDKNARSHA